MIAPRGLTLIELLAALALLGALMAAVASWTAVAADAAAVTSAPLRWRGCAEAALGLIGDDLTVGDLAEEGDMAARLDGSDLLVSTRDRGPVVHRYRHDSSSDTLERVAGEGAGRRADRRLLLDHVKSWDVALDVPGRSLDVKITADDGTKLGRRFFVP